MGPWGFPEILGGWVPEITPFPPRVVKKNPEPPFLPKAQVLPVRGQLRLDCRRASPPTRPLLKQNPLPPSEAKKKFGYLKIGLKNFRPL